MRWSAHISWLFAELPYAERVGAARRSGFTTIETAWPEHADERTRLIDVVAEQRTAARAERRKLDVALLNCPAGDVAGGERGFVNDDSRREEAERALANAIELAAAIGAHNLNLLVGRALPDVPEMRQRAAVVSALRTFAPIAGAAGLRILLEPLNSIENPGFLAATPDDAIALIEAAADDRIGLLLDVYHVARMGQDPVNAIERHAERIAHVQLSDCPGRGSPGTGKLDFAAIFARLDASGYDGAVGLEYDAGGTAEAGLAAIAGLGDGYLPRLVPAM